MGTVFVHLVTVMFHLFWQVKKFKPAEKRRVHFMASDTQMKKKGSTGRLLSIITRIFVLKCFITISTKEEGSLLPFHCW